jgi:hypothetical protein
MKNLKRKPQDDQGKVALEWKSDPLLTPEVRERQRQAAALVLEWAQEKDGYDEEIWPLIEEELGRKR